jgi:hypothetical protein
LNGVGFAVVRVKEGHKRTSSGNIRVLTHAPGRTELISLERQSESDGRCDFPQAVWSGPDAFTYLKKIGLRNEFTLRRGARRQSSVATG